MIRFDHCENLIHFTKGEDKVLDYESAYQNLKKIIKSGELKGCTGMIFGGHRCVCFTESPVRCLTNNGKLDSKYFSRYTPFGLQYCKTDVFKNGGRPVIYSTREEAKIQKFNTHINWRYVSYNPGMEGKLDFTWEREWRIKKEKIPVNPEIVKLVFPNIDWINRFIEEHEKEYHGMELDNECEECFCKREATILNFTDFLNTEQCENLIGTCPNPDKFPWILINMNEK
ncbi:hypothetical protein [Flavobacterium magnesitis]|uniref:hypothetical protein n=1 Tax=Flavobacterium magnesitis TaxID=3138077 RepID=UPI0035900A78